MFTDFHQFTDQGYLLGGNTSSYSSGANDVFLTRTDGIGNVIWSKREGLAGNDYFIGNDYNQSEGTIIVAGSFKNTTRNAFVLKLDLYENVIWNKELLLPGTEFLMSIESVSDDGFIITVMTNSFDSNSDDIIFLKGDINGEKEWAYVTGTNGHDKGISIIKTLMDILLSMVIVIALLLSTFITLA